MAHRRGFSLIELLVVVAVIALLVSVLVPALSSAKQASRLMVSLSNVRQITAGALTYTYENRDAWPISPGDATWHTLGATTSSFWDNSANERRVDQKHFNPYVYPDIDLRDTSETERLELELFRCPGDDATYQRSWLQTGNPAPDYTITSYEDVGTSYHVNQGYWWLNPPPEEASMPPSQRWASVERRTQHMFRRALQRRASNFVWLFDQKFDLLVTYDREVPGNHGGLNRSVAGYLDGHASYVNVEPGVAETDEYQVVFNPPGYGSTASGGK
ncbi:MAG: prepilin-type N-terminal cleavage/methylation domain-containing protein [Planctomycetota bacterium]